jgi:hypothetical protein
MPSKLVAVDRQDVCNSCLHDLPAGTQAWWDSTPTSSNALVVTLPGSSANGGTRVALPGWRGSSPTRNRSNDGAERVERERMLSLHLHTELASRAVVFDDRKVPGTKCHLDHLVIAPSGVWVIDANEYDGRVERRDIGGWFKVDERLFVAGKDRTHLVDGIDRQVIAVENVLAKKASTASRAMPRCASSTPNGGGSPSPSR